MKKIRSKKTWDHPVLPLIKMLTSKELKHCEKYIIAQFNNDSFQELILFKYLKATILKQSKVDFDPLKVHQKIFGGLAFDNTRLSKIAHKLKKLITAFISVSAFESPLNTIEQNRYFAKNIVHKKQYDLYEKELTKIKQNIANQVQKNEKEYLQLAQNEEDFLFETLGNKDHISASNFFNLSKRYLDFFFLKNSKIGADLSSRSLYLPEDFKLPFLQETLHRSKEEDSPLLLKLYAQIIELNLMFGKKEYAESLQKYFQIKTIFQQQLLALKNENRMHLCTLIRNYLINYRKLVDPKIIEEFFEFNKYVLDKKIFLANGILTYESFINIYTPALLLKKYQYAQNFLVTYIDLLPAEIQKKVQLYCEAKLYYVQGKFDKIEPILNQLFLEDWKFYTLVNHTLLKTLFINYPKNPDPILQRIHKLETQVKSSKKINHQQKNFSTYLSILKDLVKFRQKNGTLGGFLEEEQTKLHKIETAIESIKNIAIQKWLKKVADSFRKH